MKDVQIVIGWFENVAFGLVEKSKIELKAVCYYIIHNKSTVDTSDGLSIYDSLLPEARKGGCTYN